MFNGSRDVICRGKGKLRVIFHMMSDDGGGNGAVGGREGRFRIFNDPKLSQLTIQCVLQCDENSFLCQFSLVSRTFFNEVYGVAK